jgi:hypothetical protein
VYPEQDFVDSKTGTPRRWPFFRVRILVRVGDQTSVSTKDYLIRDAILDTGSGLTIIPRNFWIDIAHQIEWLPFVSLPASAAQAGLTVAGVSGLSFKLGYVKMGAIGIEPGHTIEDCPKLGPVAVLAMFIDDTRGPQQIVIGLHQSILQGRNLHMISSADEPFGQHWYQEDA